MKVKEILDALKYLDLETEVQFEMNIGCCNNTIKLDVCDLEVYKSTSPEDDLSVFSFNKIPGYYSCKAWKKTDDQHQELLDKINSKEIGYELHADGVKEVEY